MERFETVVTDEKGNEQTRVVGDSEAYILKAYNQFRKQIESGAPFTHGLRVSYPRKVK